MTRPYCVWDPAGALVARCAEGGDAARWMRNQKPGAVVTKDGIVLRVREGTTAKQQREIDARTRAGGYATPPEDAAASEPRPRPATPPPHVWSPSPDDEETPAADEAATEQAEDHAETEEAPMPPRTIDPKTKCAHEGCRLSAAGYYEKLDPQLIPYCRNHRGQLRAKLRRTGDAPPRAKVAPAQAAAKVVRAPAAPSRDVPALSDAAAGELLDLVARANPAAVGAWLARRLGGAA